MKFKLYQKVRNIFPKGRIGHVEEINPNSSKPYGIRFQHLDGTLGFDWISEEDLISLEDN